MKKKFDLLKLGRKLKGRRLGLPGKTVLLVKNLLPDGVWDELPFSVLLQVMAYSSRTSWAYRVAKSALRHYDFCYWLAERSKVLPGAELGMVLWALLTKAHDTHERFAVYMAALNTPLERRAARQLRLSLRPRLRRSFKLLHSIYEFMRVNERLRTVLGRYVWQCLRAEASILDEEVVIFDYLSPKQLNERRRSLRRVIKCAHRNELLAFYALRTDDPLVCTMIETVLGELFEVPQVDLEKLRSLKQFGNN